MLWGKSEVRFDNLLWRCRFGVDKEKAFMFNWMEWKVGSCSNHAPLRIIVTNFPSFQLQLIYYSNINSTHLRERLVWSSQNYEDRTVSQTRLQVLNWRMGQVNSSVFRGCYLVVSQHLWLLRFFLLPFPWPLSFGRGMQFRAELSLIFHILAICGPSCQSPSNYSKLKSWKALGVRAAAD